ncbi:MAG: FAD-dependent oxidoreductase [Candidatus Latescibacteria bacterium]|nr:FAD-dependent oxidoreductase [Candidatus Latescibacterota bacterium]
MKWLDKYKVIHPKLEKETDYPHWAISLTSTLLNRTGTWRIFRPLYQDQIPPCNNECPTNEKIQGYCDLVKQAKFAEAYKLILEDNPFPAITGRVCYHPCENSCNRKDYDDAIAIHCVERFIGDWGLKNVALAKPKVKNKKTVAIVGSGPAGMAAAYYLGLEGYQVTIFEKQTKLGGMLRYGIPAYRLPKAVLDTELKKLIKLGMKSKTKCAVGKDITIDYLRKNYDYVIICHGAHKNRPLGVPNDKAKGVISGLEFLSQINSGKKPKIGKKVAVIGGGNTAIDAARSCLRLGLKPMILYRRTRLEMPAVPDEVDACEAEGIRIEFLVAPVKVLATKKGKVTGIELMRMKLGKPDASGRRRPVPVARSNFKIKLNAIITAIGEQVDLSILTPDIQKTEWGVKVDRLGKTNITNVYAIGDCVTGPKTVVEALGAGKRTAFQIIGATEKIISKTDKPVKFTDLNLDYFEHQDKTKIPEISVAARKKNFKEVHTGYNKEMVLKESERCFSCGVCNKCDNCFVLCPDLSVIKDNGEYEFDYDYCKGCGVCAHECPRNAITMIEESKVEEQ